MAGVKVNTVELAVRYVRNRVSNYSPLTKGGYRGVPGRGDPAGLGRKITPPPAPLRTDLWPQLFSDVNCIALWINSEKFLTRLYSVLHCFHKRLEVNVKNPPGKQMFSNRYSIFIWFNR